jgi:hypothetical protein
LVKDVDVPQNAQEDEEDEPIQNTEQFLLKSRKENYMDSLKNGFRDSLFAHLLKTLEAKQCAQSMFIQKYERLDMEFLNGTNVRQFHINSIEKVQEEQKLSEDEGTTVERINGEEFDVV